MATILIHVSKDKIPNSYNRTPMKPGDKVLVVHSGECDRVIGEYIAVSSHISCRECIINKLYNCNGYVNCGLCHIISPDDALEEL